MHHAKGEIKKGKEAIKGPVWEKHSMFLENSFHYSFFAVRGQTDFGRRDKAE